MLVVSPHFFIGSLSLFFAVVPLPSQQGEGFAPSLADRLFSPNLSPAIEQIRLWLPTPKAPNGLVHRAARFTTKPIGYEKPLRVQWVLGAVRLNGGFFPFSLALILVVIFAWLCCPTVG